MENLQKRWLTPQELAVEFNISITVQNRLRSAKTMPYSRVGRQVRYDRIEIDKWLEDHRVS